MTRPRLTTAAPLSSLLGEESTRLLGPLYAAGIETAGQLLALDAFEVAQIPGMGPAAAGEVRAVLRRHGMSLKPVDAHEAGKRAALDPLAREQIRAAVQVTGGPLAHKRGEGNEGAA